MRAIEEFSHTINVVFILLLLSQTTIYSIILIVFDLTFQVRELFDC